MQNRHGITPTNVNSKYFNNTKPLFDSPCHIDHISINKDGSFLIGCSELANNTWSGAACVYKNITEAQRVHKDLKNIYLESGTYDGCFVGKSNRVLLCEDRGAVSVWCSDSPKAKWKRVGSASEHHGLVLKVDCLDPENKYVTVGSDGNIKIWDVNQMVSVASYNKAHKSEILGVAVRLNCDKVFATGSSDRSVTLRDESDPKSKLDLMENICGVRCLGWLDENRLLVGDEAGNLNLVDARTPHRHTKVTHFPAPVHRMAIHPGHKKIAMCFDSMSYVVCKMTGMDCKVLLLDHNQNYVRGITWDVLDDRIVYIVDWDTEIKMHNVS